jgi:hypothetical protein
VINFTNGHRQLKETFDWIPPALFLPAKAFQTWRPIFPILFLLVDWFHISFNKTGNLLTSGLRKNRLRSNCCAAPLLRRCIFWHRNKECHSQQISPFTSRFITLCDVLFCNFFSPSLDWNNSSRGGQISGKVTRTWTLNYRKATRTRLNIFSVQFIAHLPAKESK